MKETFYFSHDTNAFGDPKIRLLVYEFGLWSYGAFWLIIELLAQQRGFKLLRKDLEKVLVASVNTPNGVDDVSEDAYGKMIAKCICHGLLCCDDKYVWSDSFNERMQRRKDISVKRSIAGKIGSTIRWENEDGVAIAKQKFIANSKGKESKVNIYSNTFSSVWVRYPRKIGSKHAYRHFQATVKTDQDLISINKALDNYLACEEVKKGMVKYGSTWFNEWQDWVDYAPAKPKAEGSWGR